MAKEKKAEGKAQKEKGAEVETPAVAKKVKAKGTGRIKKPAKEQLTLENIEVRLFKLADDVDTMLKIKQKEKKPYAGLMMLKRRLDVLALQYKKYTGRGR